MEEVDFKPQTPQRCLLRYYWTFFVNFRSIIQLHGVCLPDFFLSLFGCFQRWMGWFICCVLLSVCEHQSAHWVDLVNVILFLFSLPGSLSKLSMAEYSAWRPSPSQLLCEYEQPCLSDTPRRHHFCFFFESFSWMLTRTQVCFSGTQTSLLFSEAKVESFHYMTLC